MTTPADNFMGCCLSPEDTTNCMVGLLPTKKAPDQIEDTQCRNIMVRHCRSSENITSDKCRTFIKKMNEHMPPLADMDLPVEAFCAMHRTKGDKHYDDCACINVANTCAGQKVIRFKTGNPACYFDDCKKAAADSTIFLTSSLSGPECKSIDCSIGPINIQMAGGNKVDFKDMINQKCGNANDRKPGDPPWQGTGSGGISYSAHTGNSCTAAPLASGSSSVKKSDAKNQCKQLCDSRDDCAAFQIGCNPNSADCTCDLFSDDGYDLPLPPNCTGPDAEKWKSESVVVNGNTMSKFDATCKGTNLLNTTDITCYDSRNPPISNAPSPA